MPSGIDAALSQMKCKDIPKKNDVSYDGFQAEKKKKLEVSEVTIVPEEEGLENCQKRVKEQEFKIRKLKEKMEAIIPNKRNKPDIQAVKDSIEALQADGNYRAALSFVRGIEEKERERKREDRDAEEALGGASKKKGAEPVAKVAAKKASAVAVAALMETGHFECDGEVVAVVTSAVEGSEEAQNKLALGAGAGGYKSEVKAEVGSIAHAATELIATKMKRAATRDNALRTVRALLWNPPAVLPSLPAVLLLLEEVKLKSEPLGTAAEICTLLSKAGPRGSAAPAMVLPVLLAHLGAAAAGKWKVKVGVFDVLKSAPDPVSTSFGFVSLVAVKFLLAKLMQSVAYKGADDFVYLETTDALDPDRTCWMGKSARSASVLGATRTSSTSHCNVCRDLGFLKIVIL
ncbi:unnamed protein product [Polarella glacialis]|uniref:Uncharacterized protein n=1 Tax=Polarella glacialis TaxID=89957 RepID=A0A813J265_POLGL|nr:unnamed protein product [Polarella glacialis]